MNTHKRSVVRAVLVGLAAITTLGGTARAADEQSARWAPYVRVDNDVFAGSDRAFTNGLQIGFKSPTVESFDDAALPRWLRALNRPLAWLQPRGFTENNVALSIGQGMFTPDESSLSEPDPLDRPYAGMLIAGITYNGRDSHRLRSTTLDLGIVGPSALAEQTQDLVHDLLGGDEFLGWDRQLRDEPVFRIVHQRLRKWTVSPRRGMADVIVHYGGSVGTLTTFANAGAELRFAHRPLPDDFGTAPTIAQGINTTPTRSFGGFRQPRVHGFLAFDARYVVRDITLDGNTWRDSASVEPESYVAELGIGFATYWRDWKITAGRYFRTKEFETEARNTTYGRVAFQREVGRR